MQIVLPGPRQAWRYISVVGVIVSTKRRGDSIYNGTTEGVQLCRLQEGLYAELERGAPETSKISELRVLMTLPVVKHSFGGGAQVGDAKQR